MSKLSDDIKKYVQGDYLTGEEYGKWGCLNRTQRKDINKLCELCDMFEKSADNFYKENLQKDQRIEELEKELEKTKYLYNDSIDREIFLTDEERRTYYKNVKLKKENAELKQKLDNAIVQKFKVGDVIWIIKRIKKEVANGKIIKQYSYFNSGTPENLRNVNRWRIRLKNNSEVTKKEYELFSTQQEAEEALRKLEEV